MSNKQNVSPFDPLTLAYAAGMTGSALCGYRFYSLFLKRINTGIRIPKQHFRKRFLLGKVTSVGDGDNFHFYHTPGGMLCGWGWLREYPKVNDFRNLKNKTISVRLCGVDSPERSHFGKPSQPYSEEALLWLRQYILGQRIWIKPFSIDQYQRAVCKAVIWKWSPLVWRIGWKDVSEQMIREGVGIVYEAKSSGEFDGNLRKYERLERQARKHRKGLWGVKGNLVTPGEYKRKYK